MATKFVVLFLVVSPTLAQYSTPVPILKQINRANEDGSYSYGYEGGDGSFKIETKYPTGEVYGKYGYVDDQGKTREIEYGATRRGFEPQGEGIQVPPPTLSKSGNNNLDDGDDGQYREDPRMYENEYSSSSGRGNSNSGHSQNFRSHSNQYQPAPQQHYQQPQQQYQQPQQQYHQPQPQPQQPRYHQPQQQYYNPPAPRNLPVDTNLFHGHPATNFDVNTGSYSIKYSG